MAPADLDQWADKQLWCPAFQVDEVASATGAGDAAIAAFLASLVRALPPRRCLKMANCGGYMNLRELDALSGLCSWDEMTAQVDDLITRDVVPLRGTEWDWDPEENVWFSE